MPGDRTDGPYGEAVIAAEQHRRETIRQRAVDSVVHELIPGRYLGEMQVAFGTRRAWSACAGQITRVADHDTSGCQGALDAGHAQRLRAHRSTPIAGTHIRGGADQYHTTLGLSNHQLASAATKVATRGIR